MTHKGVELGRPADAVLDTQALRVVGLDVACADGSRRFLPLPAVRIREDRLSVGSPLVLLEDADREFYRRRSRLFSTVAGAPVVQGGKEVGELLDLRLEADGTVIAVRVLDGSGRRAIGAAGVTIGERRAA